MFSLLSFGIRTVADVVCAQAMRFPMNQHRLELKNAQEAREREREMAKEIQEGDLDEDDLGGEFEGM